MPESVLIQYFECRLTLHLPIFFAESPQKNVKKVFKLLKGRPDQNADAFEILDRFFPAWALELSADIEQATQEHKAAKQVAQEIASKVACFGTMATDEMKAELKEAQHTVKDAAQKVKRLKTALERCGKSKNAYNEILR